MFGERLKMIRKQAGLSQKSLASRLHVSQQSVWKWERSESSPNPETLARIAEIFDISADYLLGRDEKIEPTLVPEGGRTRPREYEFLNPANKAIVDRLIADLVKSQPPHPTIRIYAAASDGSRYETEADADITLPDSVQALPDEYKGKTADTAPAPQEK